MSGRLRAGLLAGLVAAGLVGALWWLRARPTTADGARAARDTAMRAANLAGEPFPEGVSLRMLAPFRDRWGERLAFDALLGTSPLVVNVWASWCPPCQREAEVLQRGWERYGDRIKFVGIDYRDREGDAEAFVRDHVLTFPSGSDPAGRVTGPLRLFGLPTTYFVDARGRIVEQKVGELSEQELARYLRSLTAVPRRATER